MKRYILHIITFFTALLVADVAWGTINTGGTWTATTISNTQTISLASNVTITGTITIANGGKLTINGNGKTITAYTGDGAAARTSFVVEGGGTLTINNAIVTGGNTGSIAGNVGEADVQDYSGFTKSGRFIYLINTAKVYLTDVTAQYLYSINQDPVPFVQLAGTAKGTSKTSKGLLKMVRCTVQHCLNRVDNGIIHQAGGDMHADIDIDDSHIKNCMILANNTGTGYGGVIKGAGSTACYFTMDNSTMKYCWSSGWGGAVLWAASGGGCKATFTGCTFEHNYARYLGGAISSESVVELKSCTLQNNIAGYGGGALAAFPFTLTQTEGVADNSTAIGLTLENNTITNNKTLYATNYNGVNVSSAIRAKESDQSVQGVYLQQNGYFNPRYTLLNATDIYYPTGGGAIWVLMNKDGWNCSLNIGSNKIYGNSSASNGGGVFLFKQQPYSRAVSGDKEYVADQERAKIISDYSIVDGNRTGVTTMTIAAEVENNTAANSGGGIAIGASDNSSATWTFPDVTLSGGIVSNNIATNQYGGGLYMPGGNFTVSGNAEMSGNKAEKGNGGGVYVAKGKVQVNSGQTLTIHGNKAQNGGAIYLAEGNISGEGSINAGQSGKANIATANGGAIYLAKGDFAMQNCSLLYNQAVDGGAVYCAGTFSVNKSTVIQNNTSSNNGGAVYVTGGNLTLSGSNISNNSASKSGGALYVNAGNILLNGATTINSNTAGHRGGAAYVINGSVSTATGTTTEISSNTVIGDNVADTYDSGGAFYIQGESATKKGYLNLRGTTTIGSNSAIHNGGAIALNLGDVVISGANTTISGNTALNGGGVYVYNGDFRTDNTSAVTTLSNNNSSNNGGAIYVTGGNFNTQGRIDIKGNYSSELGGAIYVQDGLVSVNNPTITDNGKASGQAKTKDGGAIYITKTSNVTTGFNASGTVKINSNAATTNGGAVYVQGGNINITGQSSTLNLSGNNASNGGVFYVNGGSITANQISKATISNNYSTAEGGAFYVTGGSINLCDTELSGNGKNGSEVTTIKGGAIALHNGTFTFGSNSEIRGNAAKDNGGALYVTNASNTSISCEGGSYLNNTAGLGGGIYASGPIALTFAANVRDNIAKNGGGLYLDGGVNMSFGNGLIVGNRAEGTATYGVGGGIYLAKGTLSFTNASNLGIYNNAASYAAADIYGSGDDTIINLPFVKGMNLTGFDVPGSELYWVRDFHANRYEAMLRDLNANIEAFILQYIESEITTKTKVITEEICLDLGYDLVFVTITPSGLVGNDNAALDISYKRGTDDKIVYRQVLLTGGGKEIVGLPSGNWMFEPTAWSSKYQAPVITLSPAPTGTVDAPDGFYNITRKHNYEINVGFAVKDVPAIKKAQTFEFKLVNEMTPGGGSN